MSESLRIAVVHSPGSANWGSCHTIGRNLALAYKIAGRQRKIRVDFLNYNDEQSPAQLGRLAKKLLEGNYTSVSFIDHSPPPFELVKALMSAAKGAPLPPLVIHVYGDFTFHAPAFLSTVYLLRGQRLRLVCASPKQAGLVRNLVSAPPEAVGCCPFPVDPLQFFPVPAVRSAARRALGWKSEEFVVLYSGRLSLQKNITLMLKGISGFSGRHGGKRKIRVALAGSYDDLGAPFFGVNSPEEEYLFRTRKVLEELGPSSLVVEHLGNLDIRRLNRAYNAADALMSLSLHHDEDFGMAPAEALACGLPCLLSDWGGFPGFLGAANAEKRRLWLAPLRADGKEISFPAKPLDAALGEILATQYDGAERSRMAASFLAGFSLEAVAGAVWREIVAAQNAPPVEVGPTFVSLSKRTLELNQSRRRSIYTGLADPLYRSVYAAYLEPTRQEMPGVPTGTDAGLSLDWFTPLHPISRQARPKHATEKRLHTMLYPLTKEYSGTSCPSVFLHLLRDFQALGRERLTIVRDGAIPLVHFFRRYPSPAGMTGKIAVHEDLLGWVPPAWQPVTAAYRVVNNGARPKKARAVFLFGVNSCGTLSIRSCEAALKKNRRWIDGARKRFVYLPTRYLSGREPDLPKLEIARRVFGAVGPDSVAVDWDQLPPKAALAGAVVVDLGERLVIADPAPLHTLLRMGAVLDARKLRPGERFILLSANHGFALDSAPRFPRLSPAERSSREADLLSTLPARSLDWAAFPL